MLNALERHQKMLFPAVITLLILLIGGSAYAFFTIRSLSAERAALTRDLESARGLTAVTEASLAEYSAKLAELEEAYAASEDRVSELLKDLKKEKGRNEEFEDQIKDISGTVGKLDKLSKLDPELLMKYSKVYFLNEHYVPGEVEEIPDEYRSKDEAEYIDAQVAPYLMDLLEDAKEDGVELLVASGYRSYDEQKGLKSAYTVWYGSGANTFSADQGYSEHQLGTTVDFTTTSLGGSLVTGFESTPAFEWLTKNAHKYGFVLSYPKENAYYIYEPWHWRFVGEDLADDLHDNGKYFYDLDQREIDTYLINIFD